MNNTLRTAFLATLTLFLGALLTYEAVSVFRMRDRAAQTLAEANLRSGSDSLTQGLRSIRNDSKSDIASIESAAITKSELVSLISLLEQAGRDLGLNLTISSITSDKGEKPLALVETLRIVVDTSGSWAANMAFLRLASSLPYKAFIESADLNLSGKSWRGGIIIKDSVFPEKI